jgi:hypothetical protein
MCRPTRLQFRGRLIRLGEMSEDDAQFAAPAYWRQHVRSGSRVVVCASQKGGNPPLA